MGKSHNHHLDNNWTGKKLVGSITTIILYVFYDTMLFISFSVLCVLLQISPFATNSLTIIISEYKSVLKYIWLILIIFAQQNAQIK